MSTSQKAAADDYLDAQTNIITDNIDNMPTERHLRETPKVTKEPSKTPKVDSSKATSKTPKPSATTSYKTSFDPPAETGYQTGYRSGSQKKATEISPEMAEKLKPLFQFFKEQRPNPANLKPPAQEKSDKAENNVDTMYTEGTPEEQIHDVAEEKQEPMYQPDALPAQKYSNLGTTTSVRKVGTRPINTNLNAFKPENKKAKKGKGEAIGTTTNSFENVMQEVQEQETPEGANNVMQTINKTANTISPESVNLPSGNLDLYLAGEGSMEEAGRIKALRDIVDKNRELPTIVEHPYLTSWGGALAGGLLGAGAGAGIGTQIPSYGFNDAGEVVKVPYKLYGGIIGGGLGAATGAALVNLLRQRKIKNLSAELSAKGFDPEDVEAAAREYLKGNSLWQHTRGAVVGGADASYRGQILNILSRGARHKNPTARAAVAGAGIPAALGTGISNLISPAAHKEEMRALLDKEDPIHDRLRKQAHLEGYVNKLAQDFIPGGGGDGDLDADQRKELDLKHKFIAGGAGAGAALGGGGSLAYDALRDKDPNYSRAMLLSLLSGAGGALAGKVIADKTETAVRRLLLNMWKYQKPPSQNLPNIKG
jgi:hypothetical protein